MKTDTPSPISPCLHRRAWVAAALAAPWLPARAADIPPPDAMAALAALEAASGGRLGLSLLAEAGTLLSYRDEERFPACSTFKALLGALVLNRAGSDASLLSRHIRWSQQDLHTYAPVTGPMLDQGMTLSALAAAAVQYSDNVAANLLMRQLAGPAGVTAFARLLGDRTFRLDRWEPELNSAVPGDLRDTCTPRDMARNLRRLVLENALGPEGRALLRDWLLGNTTGDRRIRAGAPALWQVGDKTGTGEYGTTNDIAVLWPPNRGAPLVLAIYYTQAAPKAAPREDVLADATRIALAGRG